MGDSKLDIVILGLSITSSWGNGHATTYRGLVRGLSELGHNVLFLERNKPWYASQRDMPHPPYCRTALYESVEELKDRFGGAIRRADAVIVGSYVPDGIAVGDWVIETARGIRAFYDIDTPVTVSGVARNHCEYICRAQIPQYDLYLSFTGGPMLGRIERQLGSPAARVLYCSVDPEQYRPHSEELRWDLGYLGTYSKDRQPKVDEFVIQPASAWSEGRFVVAGAMYPPSVHWPGNVNRIDHLPPNEHRAFYNSQRFTLNVTRADMVAAGYSPSVRLFEAAACGVPIISDYWAGLSDVFEIGSEILVARTRGDILRHMRKTTDEERCELGKRARARVLRQHTYKIRAKQLRSYISERLEAQAQERAPSAAAAKSRKTLNTARVNHPLLSGL